MSHYTALAWGRIVPNGDPTAAAINDWIDEQSYSPLSVRRSYEARPAWVGVAVAEDPDGGLGGVSATLEYMSVRVSDLEAYFADDIARARKVWDKASEACPELGDGNLLLIADWE